MTDDDRARRRARFLRELAARDLYEWFGIPPDAGDDAVREAAERKRRELASTPMPQRTRAVERAYCDQGEKALLRPAVRREYDALLRSSRVPSATSQSRPSRSGSACGRLASASSATAMTTRMAPGAATLLAAPTPAHAWRPSGRRPRPCPIRPRHSRRRAARAWRARPASTGTGRARPRAVAHAPGAHDARGARRDTGDLAGSEAAAREGLRLLPGTRRTPPAGRRSAPRSALAASSTPPRTRPRG